MLDWKSQAVTLRMLLSQVKTLFLHRPNKLFRREQLLNILR